jgi:hypothetical protein
MKPYANNRHATRRAYQQPRRQLTRNQQPGLRCDRSVLAHALERVTEMDDEFGTTVRQNRLQFATQLLGVPFERPEALDEPREIHRGVFAIFHVKPEASTRGQSWSRNADDGKQNKPQRPNHLDR